VIELLHWSNDPDGDFRAVRFFEQHPRGIASYGPHTTPGLPGRFAGDLGVPSTSHFVVVTGDGVSRWCGPDKHWVFDGRRFAAELCTEDCRTP
jgi:hypothetical protein